VAGNRTDILYDPQDAELFNSRKWHISDTGYAVWRGIDTDGIKKTIRLHRLIMNAPEGMVVDHKNGNRLDNRRINLRVCTIVENSRNVHGAKGYCWDATRRKWLVTYKGKFYGRYESEEQAKIAVRLSRSGVPYIKRGKKYWHTPRYINYQNSKYYVRPIIKGKRYNLGAYARLHDAIDALSNMKERVV